MELDTTLGKYAGFGEAAKYVAEKEGKTVTLLDCPFAGSFDDSAKGMEFAKTMIEQGMVAVQEGKFGGETLYGSLQNGALFNGAISELVPQEIRDKYLYDECLSRCSGLSGRATAQCMSQCVRY